MLLKIIFFIGLNMQQISKNHQREAEVNARYLRNQSRSFTSHTCKTTQARNNAFVAAIPCKGHAEEQ